MGYDLMNKITSDKKIRHSNQLNATLAALPVSAKKSFLMALRNIDPRTPIEVGTVFTIKAADYASIANIGIKEAYRQLRDGALYLQQSYFTLDDKDIANMRDFLKLPERFKKSKKLVINLTKAVSYESELGTLSLEFNDYILPLITLLKGEEEKYTTQVLHSSMVLKNSYSYSLYQFLRKKYSSNKWSKSIEIDIDELKRELLCYDVIEDEIVYKYTKLAVFRKEVLDRAIAEILSKTEFKTLVIDNGAKEGKKVKKLIINFSLEDKSVDNNTVEVKELINFVQFNNTVNPSGKEVIDNRQANKILVDYMSGEKPLSLMEATDYIINKYYVIKTED